MTAAACAVNLDAAMALAVRLEAETTYVARLTLVQTGT